MSNPLLTHFSPDPERSAIFKDCIDHYDVGDPDAEWPNNVISRRIVVYGNGTIARHGDTIHHATDPIELARCQHLAAEAVVAMNNMPVGMGSESIDPFLAFFIVANQREPVPEWITEDLIWAKFAGTIFPLATITVEPLQEAGVWWSEVLADSADDDAELVDESSTSSVYLQPWRKAISWFQQQSAFRTTAFVRIGEEKALRALPKTQLPPGTKLVGCVLPRLMLGLTHQGSLVGGFGWTVQT